MKRLFTLILFVFSFSADAQWSCYNTLSFDHSDTLYQLAIEIDTVHYPNNKWQVGRPQKAIFHSGYLYSNPNVIVTDTTNYYPANDTSVFTLRIPKNIPVGYPYTMVAVYRLSFYYILDIDSNIEAKIELSDDSGVTWYNIADTLPIEYYWNQPQPDLTISDTLWKKVDMHLSPLGSYDTLLFRFTLISDTAVANKEGWLIDHIGIDYWCEGSVGQLQNPSLISLYPNPSKGNIYLHSNTSPPRNTTISVYDVKGREVYKTGNLPQDGFLHLSLPDGIYTLRYDTGEEYCVKKFVISN